MNNFKIIADSSADVLSIEKVPFEVASLRIITNEKEFVDNKELDVKNMVDFLQSYKGKSSSSCPNFEDWLTAFGDSQYIFCVPISANLSGSFNSAKIAKEAYEQEHPDRKVYVVNTLSAGAKLKLIVEKLEELICDGNTFEDICKHIETYIKTTSLLFMLESMKNLANNGRVSKVTAKAAGLLGIRVVGTESVIGELEPLSKCKGQERALNFMAERIAASGCKKGKIHISHCFNPDAAESLKAKLKNLIPNAKITIYACRALCSFYAEKGGMIVGFETF